MAFPVVQTTATTNGTTATTAPVVNLPTGIVSGETLVVLHRTAVVGAIGWPTGWTELFDDASDASDDQTACAWRKADGAEGGTITLSSGNGKFASLAYRISGATDPTVTPPQFATLVVGASTTPDPGSLSPTGGAKDYLWLWAGGWEGEQTSPPASTPTNYTNALGADSGTGGAVATNCRVASARRSLNAATENPPSWTISASDQWTATVIAVHPAGAQNFTRENLEAIVLVDTTPKKAKRPFSEATILVDTIAKKAKKPLTDALVLVDTIKFLTKKALNEATVLVDVLAKKTKRSFSEVATLVDSILNVRKYFKTLTDVVVLVDSSTKKAGKVASEVIVLVDTTTKKLRRAISEQVILADSAAKKAKKAFSEIVVLAEVGLRKTRKALVEAMVLADSMGRKITRVLLEAVLLVDSLPKKLKRAFSEVVSLFDVFTNVYTALQINKLIDFVSLLIKGKYDAFPVFEITLKAKFNSVAAAASKFVSNLQLKKAENSELRRSVKETSTIKKE